MNFREKLLQVICECYMGMHGGRSFTGRVDGWGGSGP